MATAENPAPRPKLRLDYLDALRGLAALAVGYFHMAMSISEQGLPLSPGEAPVMDLLTLGLDLGKAAVVLFFTISGFIVPISLSRGGHAPVRRFLFSRFFRLYPLYWLALALCLLVSLLQAHDWPLRTILANLTMVQGFMGFPDINGVAWTLQIEMVFYVLCLGLFLSGRLDSVQSQFLAVMAFLAVGLALAVLRYVLVLKLPVALPLALSVMFFGCLWRGYVIEDRTDARRASFRALLAFAVLLPPICLLAYNHDFGYNETWWRYLVTYFVSLSLFALCTTVLRMNLRPLAWLGAVSYSIYLLQSPIWGLTSILGLAPFPIPYGAHLYIAVVMGITVGISALTYYWVEKPMISLGRRLADSMPRRRDAPAVAMADNTM